MSKRSGSGLSSIVELGVRLLVIVGLAIQAVIHLKLAPDYQLAFPDGVGGGTMFRIEAVLALIAGGYLALCGSGRAYFLAAVVALGGFLAVVVYRYVDIATLGPIPSMYEPTWFFEKKLSALAEAAAGGLALLGAIKVSQLKAPRTPSTNATRPEQLPTTP